MFTNVPVHTGYAEAAVGWSSESGAFGRLEAGYRPLENLGLFGFGQIDQQLGAMAGLGARVTF